MGDTTIEWTNKSWNPVSGCSHVSEGCRNCYAERVFPRVYSNQPFKLKNGGVVTRKFTDVQCHPDRLEQPLHWKKPQRIFVNSMSDLFHEDVPDEFIEEVFDCMLQADWHTYQILTKRPGRMRVFMDDFMAGLKANIIEHVWLGVSVEDQQTADARIPILLQTPAVVRWVSYEPALGPVDLEKISLPDPYLKMNGISGVAQPVTEKTTEPDDYKYFMKNSYKLDWVVAGGESGPKARPMHPDWVRSVRDQCVAAGVPFFFKQWGEWCPLTRTDGIHETPFMQFDTATKFGFIKKGKRNSGRMLDGKEWNELPVTRRVHA